ncbi:MAG: AsmA-like C-terminal region-containing protein [Flavobacteriaceae bacterium]|nr:AsmA-like C-terminal region-containing protein [Flavobacteriaceae bacterium]
MKKKKVLKRILIFILPLLAILVALPFLLKDTLIKRYVKKINEDYNINITYDGVSISLIKHFPSATLTISNLSIITENSFKEDTLLFSKNIFLDINIKDAFKKNIEKIKIKELTFDQTKLNLLVNEEGVANYTIKKVNNVNAVENKNTNSEDLTFEVKNYKLQHANILFEDKKNNVLLELKEINHQGNGNFSASQTDLTTKTTVDVLTLKLGNITYFNKVEVDLDAVLGIDFNKNKFTFKENNAKINDLNLSFDGFIQLNKNDIETALSFNLPKANFKNVLSLIPSAYSSNFSEVTATGIANISGFLKGRNSDTETPKYTLKIKTNNASFKYPDLPKQVTNIDFDGAIVNDSSKSNVSLNINNLKFTIDKDTFRTNGKITNLTTNPIIDASLNGTLNLENLTQAYPIKLTHKLTGVLKADFTTHADQNAIKNNNFNKIKTNGIASLQDFSYNNKNVANTIFIKNANIKFNTSTISLTDFNAKTGKSDIKATGTLDNLYAFIFNNKDLKGKFNLISNNFVVSDFLVDQNNNTALKTEENKNNTSEALKIPAFLDISTTIQAKNVVYDNLILKELSGKMQLKKQKAILTNVKAKMLQGDVSFSGIIDTQKTPSIFNLDLMINDFDIAKSFTQLETFKKIIPIANTLNGKYDTKFKVKGNLNNDFSPDINTINGSAFTKLSIDKVNVEANPLFQTLTTNLKFLDLNKLDLKNLKTALTFKNGSVNVEPFSLKYEDITIQVTGNHNFDKTLSYNLKMDLPAKYLGNEAVNLLSKLTNVNKDTIKIPLNAIVNGSTLKPKIATNFKQAMTNLAVKVAKYQKNQLVNQATSQANDIINDVVEDNEVINDILQGTGILKPKDSAKPKPNGIINNVANDLIDGLFGKKKKKKKDTVN